jgi:hypothetical protein
MTQRNLRDEPDQFCGCGVRRQEEEDAARGLRGLQKNTAHLLTLFALSNLWMARRQLMGAVRPKTA